MSEPTRESTPTDVPGFTIAVPGDWIILDIDHAQDATRVGETIDARIAEGTLTESARNEAVDIVLRVVEQAATTGVRFAAVLVFEDEAGPLLASVTVTIVRLVLPDLSELADEPEDIGVTLHNRPTETPNDEHELSIFESRTTQVVLPAGPSVRIERTMSVPRSDGLSQDVYVVQFVLPVDEDGLTFTITGASPAIRRRAELDRVFAEIADTVRIDRHSPA